MHASCYVMTSPLRLPAVQPNSTPGEYGVKKRPRIRLNFANAVLPGLIKKTIVDGSSRKGEVTLNISKEAVLASLADKPLHTRANPLPKVVLLVIATGISMK